MKKTRKPGQNRGKARVVVINFYPDDPLDNRDAERINFLNEYSDSYTDAIKKGIDLLKNNECKSGVNIIEEKYTVSYLDKNKIQEDLKNDNLCSVEPNEIVLKSKPKLGGLL